MAGVVTRAAGGALAGANVEVFGAADGTLQALGSTGSDGSYTLSGLADGTYLVRFTAPRHVPKWFGGGEDKSTAVPVHIDGAAIVTVSETLTPGGFIRGTVAFDSSSSTRRVSVFRYLDGSWTEDTGSAAYASSSTGAFNVQVPTAQPVKLRVAWGDSLTEGYWYGDAFTSTDADTVQVDAGSIVSDVNITVPKIGYVAGKVTNSHGTALPSQQVLAHVRSHDHWVPLSRYTTSSSTNGYKVMVPAGYDVSVRAGVGAAPARGGFEPTWLDGTPAAPNVGTATAPVPLTAGPTNTLTVSSGETRLNQNVALPGGVGIVGFVRDSVGRAVPGATVTAWNNTVQWSQATTDETGWYRLSGLDRNSTNMTVRVEGTHLTTEWWKDAANQAEATRLVPFTQSYDGRDIGGISPIVGFDEAHQLKSTSPVAFAGIPRVGQYVSVVAASWNSVPDSRDYRWFCGTELIGFGEAMALDERLDGCDLTVREEASKSGWESAAVTSAAVRVDRFRSTVKPAITGSAVAGSVLTSTAGTWNATPQSISYQWLRNGTPIASATGAAYRLTTADVGRRISTRVTANDEESWTEATALTAATATIRAASSLSTTLKPLTRQIRVTFKLQTPGAARPGGTVSVYRGTKVLGHVTVAATPLARTVTYRVPRGQANFKVTYSGSNSATPVAKTAAARVR
ncbi:Carboxypeptidase regulatory-like domain-containing protein [Nocardioides scoriae]|uniref:Carboxypeptidase regulatory-like domain-containing protein n=1 Tax=Nocardioides scoriae TaxID=642780 RepID=A0A1H1VLR2_9ACTN|nr:Carboxypeptidase regulatory-like domain-containing protein [Nocardioides scoriae]